MSNNNKNSPTHSNKSKPLEAELQNSEQVTQALESELKKLKSELKQLKNEKQSPKVQKEVTQLETKVGTVLLDLAEEVPLLGKAVKWFRSWIG